LGELNIFKTRTTKPEQKSEATDNELESMNEIIFEI